MGYGGRVVEEFWSTTICQLKTYETDMSNSVQENLQLSRRLHLYLQQTNNGVTC